jgi:hypothetical protein
LFITRDSKDYRTKSRAVSVGRNLEHFSISPRLSEILRFLSIINF